LPPVITTAPAATDAIHPVEEPLPVCVAGPVSDMHELMEKMEKIRSDGNVQDQYHKLAALLRRILQF
jgi:hypothetical protein